MVSGRTVGEWGAFVGLIVTMHYAYYQIQANESLTNPNQRQELFYVKWLKEKVPALKGFGVQEPDTKPPTN